MSILKSGRRKVYIKEGNDKMSYRVRKYHKSSEQKIVETILRALLWIISAPFKLIFRNRDAKGHYQSSMQTDIGGDFVSNKLSEIDSLMGLGQPSNFSRAVLEADKLLDHILKSFCAPGLTMGDRLKSSRKKFSPEAYEAAWQAHKIRNELVHNSEYELMDYQAKSAIENYKKAIGELIR